MSDTHSEKTSAPAWGAVFDVDGTMVDNHAFHQAAWIELGARRGLPLDAEYYRHHIHSKDNAVIMENMRRNFGRDDLGQDVAVEKEAIYRELYGPRVLPMPGLSAFLGQLRRAGVPCAVASNAPEPNARLVLDRLGVADMFPVVLTPDAGFPGKPAPDLFLAAAAALGLPPAACVVFEDSYSGFLAAEAAGMPFIAVLRGANPVSLPYAEKALIKLHDFEPLEADTVARALGTALK
ncbi:MAG TPA: HAD family phosphatase [Candidatus Hydrogenedentes bacterium]|nr:HAD family phosphatase [Candidatus Hydrogenedentota bacterium]HOH49496.1 HAD family phosphatase [Candidatus Hydrogenedentota bacterium]HQL94610.1 HAD family phosphatase [Candidatus Hydrogenedentota bacterium]HRZ17235.1 HAD family phosphatase [Candidatus Hydrogenedentota bacterium]